MYKWMDGEIDDGWIDGWVDGWMDGWMDGAWLILVFVERRPGGIGMEMGS